jgi:choline dehydrogenase-like flavoprotein
VISFDHTQAHTTVGRTPLDEGSARRRDLYLTTETLYKTNIHATGGIRTHDPSKRSVADLSIRLRGHWDRPDSHVCRQSKRCMQKGGRRTPILCTPIMALSSYSRTKHINKTLERTDRYFCRQSKRCMQKGGRGRNWAAGRTTE